MSSKLNLCANLTFLYSEHKSMFSRYEAAKLAGFRGVEINFPFGLNLEQLVEAKNASGLEQVLICTYPGNLEKGDFGMAAIPGREAEFQAGLELSLTYADALNCKRVHILSGVLGNRQTREEGYKTLEQNLRHVIPLLESSGVVGLIEPINNFTIPGYFLNDFDAALSLVKSIGSPFIRLQLDIFHLQYLHGNLTNRIKECLPYAGHIQIAQVPYRTEMDSLGEIDYRYILNLLQDLMYNGWIGLEYKPSENNTEDSLKWIQKYGLKF